MADIDISQISMHDDYRCWDNPESLILEHARRTVSAGRYHFEPSQPELCRVAKRRALSVREQAASAGTYTGQDIVFHLPAAELVPGAMVKPGDAIVDGDGRRWTILEAGQNKWKQTWRCVCRDLVLAYDLRDLIDLESPNISYDTAGVAVKEFFTRYPNWPCRVQPMGEEIVEERGIRGEQMRYDVIVSERFININPAEDRILWRGKYLDILRVRNPELITELPVIEAVKKPG